MKETADIMFSLIRYELTGDAPKLPSEDVLDNLYRLSKSHDLAHLIGSALEKNHCKLPPELSKKFNDQQFMAIYRYEQSRYELERIKELFENKKIPFIPLKGSVIRELYPDPAMRTSCDIDILIHESDLKKALKALEEELDYSVGTRFVQDVSLTSPGGVHLELHFELIEDDYFSAPAIPILKDAWKYATPEDGLYLHNFSPDFFMFYHIAHMAKHFARGGCGIRPFMDLWLLNHTESYKNLNAELIKESGLTDFYEASCKLSEVWFSNSAHDSLTASMEKYLLGAGVYGSTENRVAVGRKKSGGKLSYIMSRIFLPYSMMKNQHPILKNLPILLPFFQITRWFRIIFEGRFNKSIKELKLSAKSNENQEISTLMKNLGI